MQKRLEIVIGILEKDDRLLISRRHRQAHQGGKWEFPGGKVEVGETPFAALERELLEELGVVVSRASLWRTLEFDYPGCPLRLQFWWVNAYAGQPEGREGQQIEWISREKLGSYSFPDANKPIIEALSAGSEFT